MSNYQTLEVWREAFSVAIEVHRLTEQFPKSQLYVFTSQMRRSALSIPSNIAEGKGRESDQELRRFCLIAYGSAMELETQLLLAKELGFADTISIEQTRSRLTSVLRLLNSFIRTISFSGQKPIAKSRKP